MPTDYDTISKEYTNSVERPERTHTIEYTFFKTIDDIRGKTILDLACGSGQLTRTLAQKGAKVVSIDLSREMIKIAQQKEQEQPQGITYRVGDARTLGTIGSFDIITAGFLLHYTENKNQLQDMCNTIYANLKPRGKFITLNQNPDAPNVDQRRFGVILQTEQNPPKEGAPITVTLLSQGKDVEFTITHWSKRNIQQSTQKSGIYNNQLDTSHRQSRRRETLRKRILERILRKTQRYNYRV